MKTLTEKSPWRDSSVVMDLLRLGAMHQSRISFARSITRKMASGKWQVTNNVWDLSKEGYGLVSYRIKTSQHTYHVVIFCNKIKDEERNDRVIAEKWDVTFSLVYGEVDEELLQLLQVNVPLQEAGRTNSKVWVLARANKSVRVFDNIVDSLAEGRQPDLNLLAEVGYILRTTAVYGNGKFGIADFSILQDNEDFSESFSAQMCSLYILRQFSLDWIHYLAKQKNKKAVSLDRRLQRFLGIGNATGLGMAPYLIKHPKVVDNWLLQREAALSKVARKTIDTSPYYQMLDLLQRGAQHLKEVVTINDHQKGLNQKAAQEMDDIAQEVKKSYRQNNSERRIWGDLILSNEKYSLEAQEVFISCVLELYPDLVNEYETKMNVDEDNLSINHLSIGDLQQIITQRYDWCIDIDFSKPKNIYWFWYISEDKLEPRLGNREKDKGANLELPLDIARQVKNFYDSIKSLSPDDSLTEYLIQHPSLRPIARRIWSMGNCAMGEIRSNVLGEEFLPIHILRAKLAILGATKFDPRSDRWVRVTFLQNAPLYDEIQDDDWLFPLLPKLEANRSTGETITIALNEIVTNCSNAYYGLRKSYGGSDLIAQMVAYTELLGFDGVKHFAQALQHLKESDGIPIKVDKKALGNYVIDLKKISVICYLPVLLDYFYEKYQADKQETATLTIKNCHNPWLAMNELAKMAQHNLYVSGRWGDDKHHETVECIFAPRERTPDIFIGGGADSDQDFLAQNLIITISSKDILTELSNSTCHLKSRLEKIRRNAINNGIEVNRDDWNIIKEATKAILVPSDQNSQKDAGE